MVIESLLRFRGVSQRGRARAVRHATAGRGGSPRAVDSLVGLDCEHTPARHCATFKRDPPAQGAALTLFEELGAACELKVLDLKPGKQRQPATLAIDPMGKAPAPIYDFALITE